MFWPAKRQGRKSKTMQIGLRFQRELTSTQITNESVIIMENLVIVRRVEENDFFHLKPKRISSNYVEKDHNC
jgi:hypothetical protein